MTREEHNAYSKAYRASGFGSRNDRRYYLKNAETIRKKNLMRYHMQKLSQKTASALCV